MTIVANIVAVHWGTPLISLRMNFVSPQSIVVCHKCKEQNPIICDQDSALENE